MNASSPTGNSKAIAGLWVSLLALGISGGLLVVLAWRLSRSADSRPGSLAVVDLSYQRMPADGQSDWMTGFTLTERSGRTVRWDDLTGQVRVVNFFFSSCPSVCLQENQKVRELQQAYAGREVKFLSITCDPDIDSPARLREYADKLQASPDQWLFLTGPLVYIRRVAAELFGVPLEKQTHSERLIVCDKWGHIRGTFHWNRLNEVAQLRLLVDKLLAETEPPPAAEAPGGPPPAEESSAHTRPGAARAEVDQSASPSQPAEEVK